MKKLALSATALLASATTSFACGGAACPPPAQVPEISALHGAAALAVVATVLAVYWERRRRV